LLRKVWLITILVFFVSLVVMASVYGFSDGKQCPKCGGAGETICTSCHGSWCGGSGKDIVFNPDLACPLCNGTGSCNMCNGTGLRTCWTCNGSGWYWMYAPAGSSLLLSIIFSLCFFGAFSLEYIIDAIRLGMNPWVNNVEHMGFWFNPMFFTWLFGRDRRRWAEWIVAISLLTAVPLGIIFGFIAMSDRATAEVFWVGFIFGVVFMTFLAMAWYQNYWKRSPKGSI